VKHKKALQSDEVLNALAISQEQTLKILSWTSRIGQKRTLMQLVKT